MRQTRKSRLFRARHRAAFALIEVVSLVVTVGLILSLSATALHHAFAAHHASLQHFRYVQTLQLFVNRLRDDCHASRTAALDAGLKLTQHDGRVVQYAFEELNCTRVVTESGSRLATEQWEFPPGAELRWQIDRSESTPLAIAEIHFDEAAFAMQPIRCLARCEVQELDE